jgi:hypothetical protein
LKRKPDENVAGKSEGDSDLWSLGPAVHLTGWRPDPRQADNQRPIWDERFPDFRQASVLRRTTRGRQYKSARPKAFVWLKYSMKMRIELDFGMINAAQFQPAKLFKLNIHALR